MKGEVEHCTDLATLRRTCIEMAAAYDVPTGPPSGNRCRRIAMKRLMHAVYATPPAPGFSVKQARVARPAVVCD
jgi:hypothetical protein